MGDGVLMTPALRALRQGLASAEIHIVLERPLVPLFEKHPYIDRIHAIDKGVVNKISLAHKLRRLGFDGVINFHGGPTSAWMTRTTGAKLRAGRKIYRFSNLYTVHAPAPEEIFTNAVPPHTVHIQASLVAALGIRVEDLSLHLEVSEAARKSVHGRLGEIGIPLNGYVVVQPTASFVSKQWPVERFAELTRGVRKHTGRDVVLSLPESPRLGRKGPNRLWRMALRRGDDHATSRSIEDIRQKLAGELPILSGLPLNELAALLEGASLYIGNDSGPMHVAAALKTPVIGIFGSSDPKRWHPWGVKQRTVWAGLECSPCHGKWCANPDRHACLERIEVSTVLEAALDLLDPEESGK
jgi:heptosyltransferase-3